MSHTCRNALRICAAIGAALFASSAIPAAASFAGGPAVAMVTDADCPRGTCMVVRDGRERALRPMMTLYVGDLVQSRGGSIEITMSDRQRIDVSGEHGEATIHEPGSPDSLLTRLWDGLAKQFQQQDFENASASARLGALPTLKLCLIPPAGSAFRIAAGTRHLVFPLDGLSGTARIRILDGSGRLLAERESNAPAGNAPRFVRTTVSVDSGYATALIVDESTNAYREIPIEFVVPDRVPRPPADLAAADASPRTVRAVNFAWLADVDGGAWMLEALAQAGDNGVPVDEFAWNCGHRSNS